MRKTEQLIIVSSHLEYEPPASDRQTQQHAVLGGELVDLDGTPIEFPLGHPLATPRYVPVAAETGDGIE